MFNLFIEGKEVKASNKKNYHSLCESISIIEWLKVNNNDFEKGSIFFNYNVATIRNRLNKLGYSPDKPRRVSIAIAETGILEHLANGTIHNTVKDSGFSRHAIATAMRKLNYSLVKGCYIDSPEVVKAKKISWCEILYNPMLSYVAA